LKNKTPLSFILSCTQNNLILLKLYPAIYIKICYSNPIILWTSYQLILYNNFLINVIIHPPPLFSLYNIILFETVVIKIKPFWYILHILVCKSISSKYSQNNYLKSINFYFSYLFFYTHFNRFSILLSIFFKYCFVWERVWKKEGERESERRKGRERK